MSRLEFEVRLARRDEVTAILDIANGAALDTAANFATSPEPLDEWLALFDKTHERYPWLAASDSERVIGFAKAGPYRARGAYAWTAETSVYVAPATHRQGVGRALYGRLLPMLKAQGYVTLFAGITRPNPASEALHASVGFRQIGVQQRAGWKLGRWHDVGFWEMALADGAPTEIRPVEATFHDRVPRNPQ
jgi:phosphinothricin acetyltransferase